MFEALRKNGNSHSISKIHDAAGHAEAMEKLVNASQELSHARTLDDIIDIIRIYARDITNADGATFILKDHGQCYYVDENAIGPLWKGKRFPLESCISGWAMIHKQHAAIEDIYNDPRIPVDAYRPTFVKSLLMVPVRRKDPIAAIGNYWSVQHQPNKYEISILQALADLASVAMENVSLYSDLQNKVKALQESNDELSRFASVISNDMKDPLDKIKFYVDSIIKKNNLEASTGEFLDSINLRIGELQSLIKDMLTHASIFRMAQFASVNTQRMVEELVKNDLSPLISETSAKIKYENLPVVWGNQPSLARLFFNIISCSIKFSRREDPEIKIFCVRDIDHYKFAICDNGLGLSQEHHDMIFNESSSTGIAFSTCKKIVKHHNGKIWIESTKGQGTTFYFTLNPSA